MKRRVFVFISRESRFYGSSGEGSTGADKERGLRSYEGKQFLQQHLIFSGI